MTNKKLVALYHEIDAAPFDGAVALHDVLTTNWGGVTPHPIKGIFGVEHPTNVSVQVSKTEKRSVLWGAFVIKGINGYLDSSATYKNGRHYFVIRGEVDANDVPKVEKVANEVQERVRTHSIFRGKAFKLRTDRDGDLDSKSQPEFLDLSRVSADDLFFSKDIKTQLQTTLFTPIEKTQLCREYRIPLKRGILLAGPYGTGKTLTAFVAAKKAEENGWTFIMVDRVSAIADAYAMAGQYAPAIVFAEDIDREMSGDERTVSIDDVLNTLDGLESKGNETMLILTSNHADKLNAAMLRPGRLDAIINVHTPDAEAAIKLVQSYGRGFLDNNINLTYAGERLNGVAPAVIREVVERAKLIVLNSGLRTQITTEDLKEAISSMQFQLDLMRSKEAPPLAKSANEALGEALQASVKESITSNGLYSRVDDLHRKIIRAYV